MLERRGLRRDFPARLVTSARDDDVMPRFPTPERSSSAPKVAELARVLVKSR
jgi:hypothetical protein